MESEKEKGSSPSPTARCSHLALRPNQGTSDQGPEKRKGAPTSCSDHPVKELSRMGVLTCLTLPSLEVGPPLG